MTTAAMPPSPSERPHPGAPGRVLTAADRHREAVALSVHWAEEAAASGDLHTAVSWLDAVETVDRGLTPELERRRRAWLRQIAAVRAQPPQAASTMAANPGQTSSA